MLSRIPFTAELRAHGERFVDGTRQWVFVDIEAWRKDVQGSPCRVLLAGPGFGKTAIVARYAAAVAPQHILALHLCFHNDTVKRDPIRMAKSLAVQIAEKLPAFATELDKVLADEELQRQLRGDIKVREVVDRLLIQPLASMQPPDISETGGRLLIVVDALDEAAHNLKNDLLACIANDFGDKLPKWCALLVTSRPELKVQ